MARDHAQIRLDMWGDDDWRKLTVPAQHLYMLLLTSPSLSFCGVADWRPARIAQLAEDWTLEDVLEAAAELTDRLFLVIDDATEEVLIRSFVRHDGLMKMPNMATAMATSHAAIASAKLRGVVVHELRRLHEKQPDLPGWRSKRALAVLERDCVNPSVNPSLNPSGNPSVRGSVNPEPIPSVDPSVNPSPTPTPTPTPSPKKKDVLPRNRGHRLPDDFVAAEDLRAWARDRGFNDAQIDEMTDRFRDYWHSTTGTKAAKSNWDLAWRNWVGKEDPKRVRGAVARIRPATGYEGPVKWDESRAPWNL
jgi:hypothetical protein